MHLRSLLISTFALVALTGCGQKGPSTSSEETGTTAELTSKSTAESPDHAATRTIEITASDQMKFSVTSLEAKAGEPLRVVLTNIGTMPKEAMGHNWVLLKTGVDPLAFAAAAAGARDTEYIPENRAGDILAKINLLGPRQTGEVTFKAPEEPGTYPFVCTFPGHAALMKGTLTVR